jgi:tetratricopeptide (TPR) repeat protein
VPIEEMIERTRWKVPELPGSFEKRVFIGGNYDLMPLLREIKECVNKAGFVPVLAFDIPGAPLDRIHDFDIELLRHCKYAIFEVSVGDGHMMEIERTRDFKTIVFAVYSVRDSKQMEPSPQVSSMLKTFDIPLIGYSRVGELKEIVDMIFPGIEKDPGSTWLRIIEKAWMLPEVKSRIIGQLSMDGVPRVDFVVPSLLDYVGRLCNVLGVEHSEVFSREKAEGIVEVFERQRSLYYLEECSSEVLRKDFETLVDMMGLLDKLPRKAETLDFRCALSIALARLLPSKQALEVLRANVPGSKRSVILFEYRLCVAKELYDMDVFGEALSEVLEALKVEEVRSEDVCRGKLLQASILINLWRYEEAILILGEILEKSRRRDIIVQAGFLRALALQYSCRYGESLKGYIELLGGSVPKSLELAIRNNKAIVHHVLGELKEALSELERCLHLSEKDMYGMANALGNIGLVLRQLGKPEEALKHHQQALKIHEEIGNKLGMAQDYGNIGLVLMQLGKPEEALKHHQQALKIHEEIGNKLGMANQLGNIAILIAANQPQKALTLLENALNIFNQIGAVNEAEKAKNLINTIKKKLKNTHTHTT